MSQHGESNFNTGEERMERIPCDDVIVLHVKSTGFREDGFAHVCNCGWIRGRFLWHVVLVCCGPCFMSRFGSPHQAGHGSNGKVPAQGLHLRDGEHSMARDGWPWCLHDGLPSLDTT